VGALFGDSGIIARYVFHDPGVLSGAAEPTIFQNNLQYVSLIGDIYVNLNEALVAPIILLAILSAVMSLNSSKKLKTLGSRSLFWLLLNTAISIVISIAVCAFLGIGKGVPLSIGGLDASKYQNINTKFTDVIEGFFPHNFFKELSENRIVPIIITALALAIAFISFDKNDRTEPFRKGVEALKDVVFKIVGFVVDLIPYAILALAADVADTAAGRLNILSALLVVIVVIIILCLFQTFVVTGLFVRLAAGVSPIRFFKKLTQALMAGAATQSTIAALPTTIKCLVTKIGVKEEIGNFTATLGSTVGMPGCAGIWPTVLAIFAINFLGIQYSIEQYIILGLIAFSVSFGTAGVAGTAVITATAVFTTAGLPLEVFVLLFPISFIVGMFRTPTNVSCAAAAATIVARQTGAFDEDIFYDRVSPQEEPQQNEIALSYE
jgi:Na+/H+-dicarboxylate symporter